MPTYSFIEAMRMMIILDYEGLLILGDVIKEDEWLYSKPQLYALQGAFNNLLHLKKHKSK